jgi:Tol biopolymer transport system component
MSSLDDAVRGGLQRRVTPLQNEDRLLERLLRRKSRRRIARRAGSLALILVVATGTVSGVFALDRTFRAHVVAAGSEEIAFEKVLRPCYGHPNVDGPSAAIFAVDPVTGEERAIAEDTKLGGQRHASERQVSVSPDGRSIAWVDQFVGGLFVTDVATGQATQLLTGRYVAGPRWSPDGSRIVFSALGDPENADPSQHALGVEGPSIYVIAADGSNLSRVTDGAMPVWTPDGQIAFVRSSQPSSVDVGSGSLGYGADQNSRLTFWLMDANGGNQRQVYSAPGDVPIVHPQWSADGSRIVAEATLHGNTDIYVLDVRTRLVTRITHDPAQDTWPTWSPDGTQIAFSTGRWGTGVGHSEIAVVNADGSGLQRITHDCWDDVEPSWAPSAATVSSLPVWNPPPLPDLGRAGAAPPGDILFSAETDGVSDIYAIDPGGGTPRNLTADLPDEYDPAWSPDRSQIALAGDIAVRGDLDIYVMPAGGGEPHRILALAGNQQAPSWSSDGTKLAFYAEGDIAIANVDGTGYQVLTSGRGDWAPAWSPDGTRIAFFRGDALYSIADDGSDIQLLVRGDIEPSPSWSPDGAQLAFSAGGDLFRVDANGGYRTNLTNTPDASESSPAWSPDGTQIAYVLRDAQGHTSVGVMNADGTKAHTVHGSSGSNIIDLDW